MSTKTITLSAPVEANGQQITALTFREATVGDLMAGSNFKDEMSQTIAVLASISGVSVPTFKQIKARDLKRIMSEVGDLLGNGAETTGD